MHAERIAAGAGALPWERKDNEKEKVPTDYVVRPHKNAFEKARPFASEGLMMEVCLKTGDCRFVDASSCPEIIYDKSGVILALYTTIIIKLEGREMDDLATFMKERRVAYIQVEHDDDTKPGAYIYSASFYAPGEWKRLVREQCESLAVQGKEKEEA